MDSAKDEKRCGCAFCEYRRSVDPYSVLRKAVDSVKTELADNPHSSLILGADGSPSREKAAVGLAVTAYELIPHLMEVLARIDVGERREEQLLVPAQVEFLARGVMGLLALLGAFGIVDLKAGAEVHASLHLGDTQQASGNGPTTFH